MVTAFNLNDFIEIPQSSSPPNRKIGGKNQVLTVQD